MQRPLFSCLLLLLPLVAGDGRGSTFSFSDSTDTVGTTYYAPNSNLIGLAADIASSATTTIRLATWKLSDSALSTSLDAAADSGVSVQLALVLTGGTNTAQAQIARNLVASGGTVFACQFPRTVANNFLTTDGAYTTRGNYYFSPSAVQTGAYLTQISGTNAASIADATFATLAAAGTPSFAMLDAPHEFVATLCGCPGGVCPGPTEQGPVLHLAPPRTNEVWALPESSVRSDCQRDPGVELQSTRRLRFFRRSAAPRSRETMSFRYRRQ